MMMGVDMDRKWLKHQRGQALIELIIFLPFLFILYGVVSGFAHSINGSINQQKITRAYFYYRVQNNSYIPKPDAEGMHLNWSTFGMFFIGWKDFFKGQDSPVMPCYKITIPMQGSNGTEQCEDKYTTTTTSWIRVGTVYGVCGGTYGVAQSNVLHYPDNGTDFVRLTNYSGCIID
jgi:hypothetical protein